MNNPVDQTLEAFGPATVLLDWPRGAKGDSRPWKHRTREAQDEGRLNELRKHAAAGGNLGVATGKVSQHLVSVDIDSDEDGETFLESNPQFDGALRTRGARGFQIWFRMKGEYPPSCDIKDTGGRKRAEWRADGRQSIVDGLHPSGVPYRRLVDGSPADATFDAINWPEGWLAPGQVEETPEPAKTDAATVPAGAIVLPSGFVSITKCAQQVFPILAKNKRVFTRGGVVVELSNANVLEVLRSAGFRSRLESCGQLWVWRKGRDDKSVLAPATCPEDMARALLASKPAIDLLPAVAAVTGCPVAIEDADGNLQILSRGYHPELGGLLVTTGTTPPRVEVEEALRALADLLSEFEFQSPSDRSRALAAFIAPALSIGGFIKGRVPADVAEADQSQAGKGFRQKLLATVYNESPQVVAQRDGGVGSLDESFSQALIAGRPFVQIDNLRGVLDSPFLESFFTADVIGARVPHRGEVPIDPRRYFILATSNGVESTRDFANRASFVRIRKREGHQFRAYPEGGLLEHVKARQPYYLGCVFSIVAEWLASGKPRTKDTRHDFREWAQVLDWIVQKLFGAARRPCVGAGAGQQPRLGVPARVVPVGRAGGALARDVHGFRPRRVGRHTQHRHSRHQARQ